MNSPDLLNISSIGKNAKNLINSQPKEPVAEFANKIAKSGPIFLYILRKNTQMKSIKNLSNLRSLQKTSNQKMSLYLMCVNIARKNVPYLKWHLTKKAVPNVLIFSLMILFAKYAKKNSDRDNLLMDISQKPTKLKALVS